MNETGRRIDWEAVKKRLQASELALEKALTANEEGLDTVYRQRAAQLANRQVQGAAPATALRVLVFSLGAERYAFEFADLVELLPFVNCTPVPGGPPQLLGVINVHGEIRSVVDLGRLLDLSDRNAEAGGYVLLLRKQGRQVGVRVDRVESIELLAAEQLAAPSDREAGAAPGYLRGLTPTKLRLLNTDAILAHPLYRGR